MEQKIHQPMSYLNQSLIMPTNHQAVKAEMTMTKN